MRAALRGANVLPGMLFPPVPLPFGNGKPLSQSAVLRFGNDRAGYGDFERPPAAPPELSKAKKTRVL
jgi:hypothetical protein